MRCMPTFIVIFLITTYYVLGFRTEDAFSQECPALAEYVTGEVILTFKPEYMPAAFEVAASPPSVGMTAIDSIFTAVGAYRLVKLVPTYDVLTTSIGQALERTFLLAYDSGSDPLELASALEERPEFERVSVNRLWQFELHGTKRLVPSSETTRFGDQWYLDDSPDLADIDAPEAWAIEVGDPAVVVGIYDSGTMLDMCVSPWRLHSDMNYYFVPGEDQSPVGQLTAADLSTFDDNEDGFVDNVIGTNVTRGCGTPSEPCGSAEQAATWKELPVDWVFQIQAPPRGCPPAPISWDIEGSNDHGTRVGSIAVGKLDSLKANKPGQPLTHKDIVGVAHGCKVLNARFGCPNGDFDAAQALLMLADHCRVINMSFGVSDCNEFSPDGTFFSDAVTAVTSEPTYDCVLVASTGNGDLEDTINYPAVFDSVLAVGAISRTSASGIPVVNFYSNYSLSAKLVDLVAPTEESPLNVPAGTQGIFTNRHSHVSSQGGSCGVLGPSGSPTEQVSRSGLGTSFAAPQVAGAAALVRSRFPGLNQFEVKRRLMLTAEHFPGWGARPSYEYGWGKVNAYRALTEWGSIKTSTTWRTTNTRDGKYYISGDLTIESGDTLTINPGVVVKVAPDHEDDAGDPDPARVRIVVKSGGALRILGDATNRVTFESFTDSPATTSDWSGIEFEAGSSGTLSYVEFKNAKCAIVNYAPLTGASSITNCTFTNCETAIEARADLDATGSLIVRSSVAVDIHAGDVTLTKCTIANNTTSAAITRTGTSLEVSKCVTAFNGGPAVHALSGGTGLASMDSSVVFQNGSASGSRTDADWQTQGQVVYNLNPAFCDAASNDYRLYAYSPASTPVAPNSGYFGERVGAFDAACVPSSAVVAVAKHPISGADPWIVMACPKGDADTLVVTVNLGGSITRTIDTSEITLDVADVAGKVFDTDGYVTADTDAGGPSFETTITHAHFGGCGVNDADILLNGMPLTSRAHFEIRTIDTKAPYGVVDLLDFQDFGLHYQSPPKPYSSCYDVDDNGELKLADFAFYGAHYQHLKPTGYELLNPSAEPIESDASVSLQFTEEFPTATSHRLYVDVGVENFASVALSVFSIRAGSDRLVYAEWLPAEGFGGEVMFAPVVRDGVDELFFGLHGLESSVEESTPIGRLIFDVTGQDPITITDDHFVLTIGDVLLEAPSGGPVVARMGGAFSRTFDPAVARIYYDRLEQNFPNPFNPTTTLAFSIKNATHVSLAIYDVAGRRVRELVSEQRERGAYRVVWDGKNDSGAVVASGVYFYKLVAGSFTDTKKMTILK